MLEANVDGTLAQARIANMQSSLGLPDGYTMLHAACHMGTTRLSSICCHAAAAVVTR